MISLNNWRPDPLSRESILSRARRKPLGGSPVRERVPGDDDEALRSAETRHRIQSFYDVLQGGDEAEQARVLGKIIESWRADNAAGGLPVYAHRPLPQDFARDLAGIFKTPGAEGKATADAIAVRLEPGTSAALMQQIAALKHEAIANAAPAEWMPDGEEAPDSLGERDPRAMALIKSLLKRPGPQSHDSAHARTTDDIATLNQFTDRNGLRLPLLPEDDMRRAQTLEFRPDRDGSAQWQNQPWDGRREPVLPVQSNTGQPLPDDQEMYDADAPWFPLPTDHFYGPSINRRSSRDPSQRVDGMAPTAPDQYQPGHWRQRAGARTETGKVLVGIDELPLIHQQTLRRRGWMHPTGVLHGNERLENGFGYFGATRLRRGNVSWHGGYDAVANEMNTVQMPTDARLVSMVDTATSEDCKDKNGRKILDPLTGKPRKRSRGYTLTFDLGNGMRLSLLHVRPTQNLRVGQNIGMGELIGEVDTNAYCGTNDHTHMQITMQAGHYNGQDVSGFAVDPTDLVERNGEPRRQHDDNNFFGREWDEFWRDLGRRWP